MDDKCLSVALRRSPMWEQSERMDLQMILFNLGQMDERMDGWEDT